LVWRKAGGQISSTIRESFEKMAFAVTNGGDLLGEKKSYFINEPKFTQGKPWYSSYRQIAKHSSVFRGFLGEKEDLFEYLGSLK